MWMELSTNGIKNQNEIEGQFWVLYIMLDSNERKRMTKFFYFFIFYLINIKIFKIIYIYFPFDSLFSILVHFSPFWFIFVHLGRFLNYYLRGFKTLTLNHLNSGLLRIFSSLYYYLKQFPGHGL